MKSAQCFFFFFFFFFFNNNNNNNNNNSRARGSISGTIHVGITHSGSGSGSVVVAWRGVAWRGDGGGRDI